MLRLLINDEDFDPPILFAECELDLVLLSYNWISNNTDGNGRLCFGQSETIQVKDRHFSIELEGDSIDDFDKANRFELLVGGSDADIKATAKKPSDDSNGGIRPWKFRDSHKQSEFTLARGLMFDSSLTLQWDSGPNKRKYIKLPITIDATEADVKRYNAMQAELEQHGLFSFVYDSLRGLFSRARIDLSWDYGKSVFSGSDAELEKQAIRQIWEQMFSEFIPGLLRTPIWTTLNRMDFLPIGKVRRLNPSTIQRFYNRQYYPHYVFSSARTVSFEVEPHILLYSFLNRILKRYQYLINSTCAFFKRQFQRDYQEEESNKYGKYHPGVIAEINQKLLDIESRYKNECSLFDKMQNELRQLATTQVFRDIPCHSHLSYQDVPSVEFCVNQTYKQMYLAIKAFDSLFFNWQSRIPSDHRTAKPKVVGDDEGESLACWKYSKMYQYWVYFQLCNAALKCGLKRRSGDFHSGNGSWVLFESNEGFQFKLFHEVKGAARGVLESESNIAPLNFDCWCASNWMQNEDYMTPDFVCEVSPQGSPSFLIVMDAKINPMWCEKEHTKAQEKYAGFRLLKKGYNGIEKTPEKAICTQQSWIVYPANETAIEIKPGQPWKYGDGKLIRLPGANSTDVCFGRLQGQCKFGGDMPFKMFFEAQLSYCRSLTTKR